MDRENINNRVHFKLVIIFIYFLYRKIVFIHNNITLTNIVTNISLFEIRFYDSSSSYIFTLFPLFSFDDLPFDVRRDVTIQTVQIHIVTSISIGYHLMFYTTQIIPLESHDLNVKS